MGKLEVQRKVRELIVETDRLSRDAHAAQSPHTAEVFAALRSTLSRLERSLGDPGRVQERTRGTLILEGHGGVAALTARLRDRLAGTWVDPARLAAEPTVTAGYAAEGLLALAFAASPFAFGYARRRPLLAAGQVAVAAGYVAARLERSRAKRGRTAIELSQTEPEAELEADAPDEGPPSSSRRDTLADGRAHPVKHLELALDDEDPIVPSAPIDVL